MKDDTAVRARVSQSIGVIAVLFGLATLAAGASVLAGRDPGYGVYRPLLVFNTLMGVPYVIAGIMAWRRARTAWMIAGAIAVANLLALAWIVVLSRAEGPVAPDSLRAMLFRTGVWLVLLIGILWAQRASRGAAYAR